MSFRVIKSSNKFNAKGRHYNGKWYDSTGEMNYAQELDLLLKAGEIQSWERQVKISLDVNGIHICNYYVDFRIVDKNGTVKYIEYKGFETPEWKMKWNLFTALIGDIDPGAELVVVKHRSYKPKRK